MTAGPIQARAARERVPVVVAAGGTGGHVFPAAALIEQLAARGVRSVALTDRRAARQNFGGAERYVLQGSGIAGRGLAGAAAGVLSLARATLTARRILARLRPEVVVGFGGYAAVAPVLAARSLQPRPRVVLHEQNAVLGRANRLLCHVADDVALGFPDTHRAPVRARYVGNPVRASIAALRGTPYRAPEPYGRIAILVLGGSLGARVFSDLVPRALAASAFRSRLEVMQQCRPEDLARVEAAYRTAGIRAELATFFADVPRRIAEAHLVIARAGASTLAELAAIGRPQLLVPLPGAIDDHQRANARAAAASGAAEVIDQVGLTPARLGTAIMELLEDPETLREMAEAAARAGARSAADELADLALGHGALVVETAR